jgi:Domain of unknown function (DUF5666)
MSLTPSTFWAIVSSTRITMKIPSWKWAGHSVVGSWFMGSRKGIGVRFSPVPAALLAMLAMLVAATAIHAQTPARFLGAITAVNGNSLTVKTAAGDVHQFDVPASASIRRIEPGQTSLSGAVTIPLSDLAVGDRVLVLLGSAPSGSTPEATEIIAIKHEDVVKKQEEESQAWANGVGGLVKSVDPSTGTIVLAAGAGLSTKSVTIHTTASTVLKRYAPASVSYAQAKPAPITEIHAGDQLMARGTKNADSTEMDAQEVVSGSFRNVSGLITSVNTANTTITVKDLLTKKDVTIDIPATTEMRKLPERMAQFLAARLKGETAGGGGRGAAAGSQNGGGGGMRRQGPGGGEGGHAEMNPQQILSRAPEIKFADLQKGDAVMLVATQGTNEVTAITLVAGVEPLLEAPASRDLLSSWSMNNGSAAAEGAGTQ